MKKTIKKILPVLIVAFVLVSALAVTVFATDDYSWVGKVALKDMSQSGVEKSGYTDIDGNADWIQVSSSSAKKALAYQDTNAYWSWNYRAYYNSTMKTLVIVPTNSPLSSRDGNLANPVVISDGDGQVAAADIGEVDERYYAARWNGDSNRYYYVHNLELWLDEFGADVEHLQIRNSKSNVVIGQEFSAYIADDLVNAKTIKYPADATFRAASADPGQSNRLFRYKGKLTTAQYGTFDSAGKFTTACAANAVTLKENQTGDARYSVSAIILEGCSSVTRVIIESNTANYIGLRDNMFNGCTSLKFVYIGVAMSDAYRVGSNVFNGCEGVNVYVDNVDAATSLAAFANIALKLHSAYEADIREFLIKNAPIYADGILVKIADTNTASGEEVAIRFIFRWDEAGTVAVGTPVKVGVVACSADYYAGLGSGLEEEKLAALLADTNTVRVKKNEIAVYKDGELSLKGKFLKDGTDTENGVYSYAYTLYGIPKANYDSEIYAATYIQWADGTYSVVSNRYDDPTTTDVVDTNEKNTISLYDATLGLFKNGLINSEKVDAKYLWNVIENYAAHSHAMTSTSDGGSNVKYFFFPDNIEGGYVLAYRAIDATQAAIIPHNGNYWGAPAKWTDSIPYHNETHTFVVDYGVTGVGGARVFGGPYSTTTNKTMKTVVYPSNFSLAKGSHAFHILGTLENVIWCHTDADGNYVEHMSDIQWNSNVTQRDQLFDMRGFGDTVTDEVLSANMSVYTNATIKFNIILARNSVANTQNIEKRIVWKES